MNFFRFFFERKCIYWVVVSNIFYFHPYLGRWSNLTNIFQMGWNHQLDYDCFKKRFWKDTLEHIGRMLKGLLTLWWMCFAFENSGASFFRLHIFFCFCWGAVRFGFPQETTWNFLQDGLNFQTQNKTGLKPARRVNENHIFWAVVSNILLFSPLIGEPWSNLTNIFHKGWNHQLVISWISGNKAERIAERVSELKISVQIIWVGKYPTRISPKSSLNLCFFLGVENNSHGLS